jgi:glycosyltransferase involved in cell wall biosynthesis
LTEPLRVALVAGTLGQGGAEKQLTYMARGLHDMDVDCRVYAITRDEFYAGVLARHGIPPVWLGPRAQPLHRLGVLIRLLRQFRPHVVQAGHFFVNLYVTLAARACGAMPIGTIRNDARHELDTHGGWGPALLRLPPSILANSWAARDNAEALGVPARRLHVLTNVIDLAELDRALDGSAPRAVSSPPTLLLLCRLYPVKRVDRFLRVVELVRRRVPDLRALIVGDGSERAALEATAVNLGLLPGTVEFLGRRDDVASVLTASDVLVVTSDHEGFPNVILEAMAAGLPVVTTPAGDAARIVEEGATGHVVGFEDIEAMADRLVQLLADPARRKSLGTASRQAVESRYAREGLAERLIRLYAEVADQQKNRRAQAALAALDPAATT